MIMTNQRARLATVFATLALAFAAGTANAAITQNAGSLNGIVANGIVANGIGPNGLDWNGIATTGQVREQSRPAAQQAPATIAHLPSQQCSESQSSPTCFGALRLLPPAADVAAVTLPGGVTIDLR